MHSFVGNELASNTKSGSRTWCGMAGSWHLTTVVCWRFLRVQRNSFRAPNVSFQSAWILADISVVDTAQYQVVRLESGTIVIASKQTKTVQYFNKAERRVRTSICSD
jgi:hypothetical protein